MVYSSGIAIAIAFIYQSIQVRYFVKLTFTFLTRLPAYSAFRIQHSTLSVQCSEFSVSNISFGVNVNHRMATTIALLMAWSLIDSPAVKCKMELNGKLFPLSNKQMSVLQHCTTTISIMKESICLVVYRWLGSYMLTQLMNIYIYMVVINFPTICNLIMYSNYNMIFYQNCIIFWVDDGAEARNMDSALFKITNFHKTKILPSN